MKSMINPRAGNILNNIGEGILHFEKEFEEKGIEYIEGYLSAFSGIRKWLTEHGFTKDYTQYIGAKYAIENLKSGKSIDSSVS